MHEQELMNNYKNVDMSCSFNCGGGGGITGEFSRDFPQDSCLTIDLNCYVTELLLLRS